VQCGGSSPPPPPSAFRFTQGISPLEGGEKEKKGSFKKMRRVYMKKIISLLSAIIPALVATVISCSDVTFENPNDPGSSSYIPRHITADSETGLELDGDGLFCSFGDVPMNAEKSISFTMQNMTKDRLQIINIELNGEHAGYFQLDKLELIDELSQDQTTDFHVTFSPTVYFEEFKGNISANLTIETSDPYAPVIVIELRGCCIVSKMQLEYKGKPIVRNSHVISSCALGESDEMTFIIKNTGHTCLHIFDDPVSETTVATGSVTKNFSVIQYPDTSVNEGDTTFFKVKFDPEEGMKTYAAMITIISNDEDSDFSFFINYSVSQKITHSEDTPYALLGSSVCIDGNIAIAGAKGCLTNSGSASIYQKGNEGSWSHADKLTPSESVVGDYFGNSVSINGDYAIVGALFDDDGGKNSGAVYIFKRDTNETWSQLAKLTASDGAENNNFGRSVSINGDYAIVGAYNDAENAVNPESAYIFKRNSDSDWSETKLAASDGNTGDSFGCSVYINGNYAIVGAKDDDDKGDNSGSAYIFKKIDDSNWIETKLTASDENTGDNFGCSVSINGDYAIVGARGDDDNGDHSGSVYIFRKNADDSWTETKLTASDAAAMNMFGQSVCINEKYAIVGSKNSITSGSAYIFLRDGNVWTELEKLTASDGDELDFFAESVSIDEGYAIVGARGDDAMGNLSGSVYFYTLPEKFPISVENQKLTASDAGGFGYSVSVSGEHAIIGAFGNISKDELFRTAYIFKKSGSSWNKTSKLTTSDIGTGFDWGDFVSINGDYAIAGSFHNDDKGEDSGAAYIFKRKTDETWAQTAKLTASDGAANDKFGYSVSIYGDYTVVGAFGDDDNGEDSGAAYIFKKITDDNWKETKLTVSGVSAGDEFGYSVSISGDHVIVGAPYDDDKMKDSGAAYIFRKNADDTWAQTAKLTASDGVISGYFGKSVCISGDYAIVGAPSPPWNNSNPGSVYIYERNSSGVWEQCAKFTSWNGAPGVCFGCSVSISGDNAVAGEKLKNYNGSNSGIAHLFHRDTHGSGLWVRENRLVAGDNAVSDQFGYSISIDGDNVLSGALGDNGYTGAAYFFRIY